MNKLYNVLIPVLFLSSLYSFQPQTKEELQTAVDLWVDDNATAISTYGEINTWDVSLITYMSNLFHNKSTFNSEISNWDVSSVTDMKLMFHTATSFNGDLSNWDVSSVTNMTGMFRLATSFNGDLSNWNVSNVTNMKEMFTDASSYEGVNGLDQWDVSSVTDAQGLTRVFEGTPFNQDISTWNVSNAVNMMMMFRFNTSFNQDLSTWDVSNVNTITEMFRGATSFDQDLSSWDVSNVTLMDNVFLDATSLSDENSCLIHNSWSSNSEWPYDWSGLCSVSAFQPATKEELQTAVNLWIDDNTTALSTYGEINTWDVSLITDMSELFKDKTTFNDDIGEWNLSNVTKMNYMFWNAVAFDRDISSWNVSSVAEMGHVFRNATTFNQDISSWNVSNVYDLGGMFWDALAFNQDISSWDISSVINTTAMFRNATTFNQDISSWDISNIVNMSQMFRDAIAFNQDISTWDVSNVNLIDDIFLNANALSDENKCSIHNSFSMNDNWPYDWSGLCSVSAFQPATKMELQTAVNLWVDDNASALSTYGEINTWDVSLITDMSILFAIKTTFNDNISSWDVSNVTNMNSMFTQADSFNQDISNWDVSNVIDMSFMFKNASSFNQDISNWDVSNVTNMIEMFYFAESFNGDISSWDVSNVLYMNGMFKDAESFNQNLSSWDVSSVTNMAWMFAHQGAFNNGGLPLDWNTSNVTNMEGMFFASNFDQDISDWNVSSVTKMNGMFYGATLNQDITNWNVSSVTTMEGMFLQNGTFNQDISNWDVSNVIDFSSMFGQNPIFDQDISSWDVSSALDMSGMFTESGPLSDKNRCAIHMAWSMIEAWPYDWSDLCFQPQNNGELHTAVDAWIADSVSSENEYGHISVWDVSLITNMDNLFRDSEFNSDISNWDVSNVTSMKYVFISNPVFNQDISNWDVSKVTNMDSMFRNALAFNCDLSSWDVSSVTYGFGLFANTQNFNCDLSSWDVSNMVNMTAIFESAIAFNGDISTWDVSSARTMQNMFWGAASFNQDLSSWNPVEITNMVNMFGGSNALSDENKCLIHLAFSSYNAWQYDWASFCAIEGYAFIPDDNFEQALIELGYDDVLDNYVLLENISTLTELYVTNMGINDLTGIENFTALEYLHCGDNLLSSIDITSNPSLRLLHANNNQLYYIDLNNNSLLTNLILDNNNFNNISVANNILLEQFDMQHNQLRNINLGLNTALKTINFNHNQLSNIDVSSNLELEVLSLGSNQISVIDISNNAQLKHLELSHNQLSSIDLSNNQMIEYFGCNDMQLDVLDLSQNPELRFIRASSNAFESLDFSNNPLLYALEADHNMLSNIDLSNNTELLEIGLAVNQLDSLIVDNLPLLTHISAQGNNLTGINVNNNPHLHSLQIQDNLISNLNLDNNDSLEYLFAHNNQISSLNLGYNSILHYVDIFGNELTELNLKGAHPNQYTSLNVLENPNLECVDVLDPEWATENWQNNFDENVNFEFICGADDRSIWHVSTYGSDVVGEGSIEDPLESIQLAIDVASSGDSVIVGEGIFYENITWEDKDLSIIGSGPTETIIDAQQLNNGIFIWNVSDESLLTGITVRNGATVTNEWPRNTGGGIFMHDSDLKLKEIVVENCVLLDQEWENGNGIFIEGSSSIIEDVIVRNNQGGGIALGGDGSYPSFNNVLIEGNTQGYGMRVYDTGIIMQNSEISNNTAGGIWYEGVGYNPSFYLNNVFSGNGSENSDFGGLKVLNSGADVTIDGCLFFNNNSYSSGSDLFSESFYFTDDYFGNDIEIINSVFYNEQSSSIYLVGNATADTLKINYSNVLNEESIIVGDGNHVEYGLGMIFEDPMFCDEGYGIDAFSPLVGAGSNNMNMGNLVVECGFEPKITEIMDIPNDQGGRIYLEFTSSPFDNEGDVNQLYTILRMDLIDGDSTWVTAASGAAVGEYNYTYEVLTLRDSNDVEDGVTYFKVVASMNEGIYTSTISSGYSMDNIIPTVPTGMLAASVDNYISIGWDVSPDEDFQYFELIRSGGAGDDIIIELVETMYEDYDIEAGVEYSYKLAAYDYNGNFSGYSEPILASMLNTIDNGLLPSEYALHQNYPNPFNPTTKINYQLPEDNYISIIIYDVMGHEVKSLVNNNQEAGYKTVHWDATNNGGKQVPAGMYIYTIQAGAFRQTKKMVLLK